MYVLTILYIKMIVKHNSIYFIYRVVFDDQFYIELCLTIIFKYRIVLDDHFHI